MTEKPKKIECPSGWGTRHTLAILGFLGFTLSYSMRFNLSLAMVSMVAEKDTVHVLREGGGVIKSSQDVCPVPILRNELPIIGNSSANTNTEGEKKFTWNEREQGLLMGCFFWGYVVTQYPGGRLSHYYGAKWVISIGLLATGILSLLLPSATLYGDKTGLMFIRILQGLAEGVTFPAMHCMLGKWAPPQERSRITTIIFSGVPFGTAATMVAGGYIIRWWGWPSLFYSVGVFSIVWFLLWTFFVSSDPNNHPTISFEELEYIQASLEAEGGSVDHLKDDENHHRNNETPWSEILKSLPVWSIAVCHIFHSWSHYLLHTETPKYLQAVHHFPIEHNGWFSASPQFINFGVSLVMASVSDFLIKNEVTSIVFTRKLCTTIALWGSAAAFVGIILGGCNTILAVTCLNIAGGALGAGFGGWVVNNIDVSPNYAGTIMGVTNCVSNSLGFIAPFVSGLILHAMPEMQLTAWKIIFLIPTALNIVCCVFYLIFASANVQSWNSPKVKVMSKPI